jgi:hypothetical protein
LWLLIVTSYLSMNCIGEEGFCNHYSIYSMPLYKYLHPDRIDVLQNLRIRFTQPHYLNDPFESNPVVTGSEATDEDWERIAEIECRRNGLNLADFKHMTKKDVRDRMFPEMWEIMKAAFHYTSGILSLTEDPLNVLMWSHYANNHQGFVVGFNSEHPFFPRSDKPYIVNSLNKVEYAEKRPVSTLEKFSLKNMFFTKSMPWSYEKEWRMFKNISTADQTFVDGEVALFSYPKEIIDFVLLGAATSAENEEEIVRITQAIDKNVPIYKSRLHSGTYQLEMISYEEWIKIKEELKDTTDLLERFKKEFNDRNMK